MPRPGVDVEIVDEIETGGAILDTGQGMFAGYTERGRNLSTVHNLADYKKQCGGRNGNAAMYDSVMAFFMEGGQTAYIARANGGVEAEGDLGTWAGVRAKGPGEWGNDIKVSTVTPVAGSGIQLKVECPAGTPVELSSNVSSLGEAQAWESKFSNYIEIDPGTDPDTLPAAGVTVTLTGGTDAAASSSDIQKALDFFTYDLGPAQVSVPGDDDPNTHTMVGSHCAAMHRCGLVDLPMTTDAAALGAAIQGLNGQPNSRYLLACGHYPNYPAETPPASITIPYSGMQMGIIARTDRGGDPSAVAAGAAGISRHALGLNHQFTEAETTNLNAMGVCLGRQMYGSVRTYGYRTAIGPPETNWLFFQESRVIMAIAHECNAALEEYVFNTVDGRNHLFIKARNTCVGICQRYWQANALFGETPDQAFYVDTANVNTIDTIKAGEVHVALYLKTSKVAEYVKVEIIKVPLERELAVAA